MTAVPSTAIVIGAGFSGMASALILARHGCKVTLVERAARPGITMRGFSRKGVYYDSGLHFVGELSEQGVLRAYLRYLGLGDLPLVDFDPEAFEVFRFSDGSSFSLPMGHEAMTRALVSAFPGEERGIREYMEETRRAYAASAFNTLDGSFAISGERDPRWQVSLEAMLDQYVTTPRARTILSSAGWLYGVSPRDVPFLLHARVAGSHFDCVRMFKGGGISLIKACEQRLKEEGVTLLCGSGVRRILFSSASTLTGVELDNAEQVAGETVIYTGHPAYLPEMLPENVLKPVFRNRLRLLADGASAHMLFLSGKTCPEALRGRNLVVFRHDEPFADAFAPGRLPSQGPFYVLPGSSFQETGGAAKTGEAAVGIVALVIGDAGEYARFQASTRGNRPREYKDLKKERLSQFAEALFAACPDLSGLDILDGATPLTLRDWLHSPQGGLYGSAHNMTQFNPIPITRVPNLYAAGQAVAAPGLMGTAISAFLTCGCILGHEALLREVRSCKRDA